VSARDRRNPGWIDIGSARKNIDRLDRVIDAHAENGAAEASGTAATDANAKIAKIAALNIPKS
jgi:hypothetical protein